MMNLWRRKVSMSKELTEQQLKQKYKDWLESLLVDDRDQLGGFDCYKEGYRAGREIQGKTEPFAYVIDDGFRQQITVIVSDETRETAKRFGWGIIPLYAIPEEPSE